MIKWRPPHLWEHVAETLRSRIVSGEYPPQSRMPSIRTVMQEFEVGRNTALHALEHLEEEGYAVMVQSQGTFVTPPEEWPSR
ncbi:winged helix-turn-helix domain-containing protein [Nonomuraea sp. NPDC049655]|uniref:winged helix-turn-helix domain-containing protein n=1 Tax=Nonomuraea sp. NPDC049655 TaxID=3364355 RepID=UPI0037BDE5E5